MAAFYLCVVVAAIGASKLMEGPNDRPNAEHSYPDVGGYTGVPSGRDIPTVVEAAPPRRPMGEVNVEPTGEPTSVAVPAVVPPVELGYDGLYCSYPWDCTTALRVFHKENPRQDPGAISYTGDYGLCQINRATWERWLNERGFNFEAEWMIPERNVAMAWEIQRTHGWDEWTTY